MAVMTENKVVPKNRFSSFNSNWITKSYGDIYSFYSTNSLSRDKLNYESGRVFNIHYGDIHTKFSTMFDLKKESTPLINLEVDLSKYSEEKYCQEGDLVIADASEDYADIGKTIELINLNNERVLAGLHTFLARPNKYEMAKGFAGYLMQSWNVRKQVMVIAQGSKVLGLATGRLAKIKLFIPEYQEQQKIASFLSAVDEKLQHLTKKKDLLEEYKKGVMQKIFSQELRFKDEFGNNYPDWEEKKLGELCEFAKSGGTPKSTNKEYYNGNIPFLSISDMTKQGKYLNYATKSISEEGVSNSSSWIVPINTIIYSMYASVGFVAINKIPIATSQAVINLGIKSNCNTEFIYYNLVEIKNIIHRFIETGTQGNLNAQTVKNLKLELPCLKEQEKIADFLSAIDKKIELVSTQIENTKAFKKGLLHQMFV